jgi:hypothetical protein
MQKQIKILGIASLTLGVLSAIIWMLPYGLMLALPIGFLGMVISTIYVYMDTKYEINAKKITPGIIGIILSSIPIIIVLIIIIMSRFK